MLINTEFNYKEIKKFFIENIDKNIHFENLNFLNNDLNSRFIFDSNTSTIDDISFIEINNYKIINLYFKIIDSSNSYLQFIFENDIFNNCYLFTTINTIYPSEKKEWIYWLGNEHITGIINDDIFILEDTPLEKTVTTLYKIVKKIFPNFNNFTNVNFNNSDSNVSTNLLHLISSELGISIKEVFSKFNTAISSIDWIIDLLLNESEAEFYIILSEGDLESEYKKLSYFEKLKYIEKSKNKENSNIKKESMIFYRDVENEFYSKEYIKLTINHEKFSPNISIDIGIPLSTSDIKLL
ncbi:hypothetical protein EV215_0969 [Hypnocyclicus thermotrophus]|uniref:Uncharacterized protein n=1 Tax=Hypnocyclicus thermotrophus TaxID=1627895 RepID=A0AA46DZD5_9FUSO|nr:hypothetical protein [Hypnocyclicus thermotrophus]TDT71591.1 hypothetical protein EV215_0969 [Hypnocyclicus thermotrophus]